MMMEFLVLLCVLALVEEEEEEEKNTNSSFFFVVGCVASFFFFFVSYFCIHILSNIILVLYQTKLKLSECSIVIVFLKNKKIKK